MADPTETLGMETGNPDAGTAGLGLVTPDLLAQERMMQWRNMLASPIAQNPYRAVGLMSGQGLGQTAQAIGGGMGAPSPDYQMQQARQNLTAIQAAQQASSQAGDNPLDQQAAYYGTIYKMTGHPEALKAMVNVATQRQAMAKSQADQFKATGQGMEAMAKSAGTAEVGVPGNPDMVQRVQWNPSTQAYDIPVGSPVKRQAGVSVNVGDKDSLPFFNEAAKAFAPQYQQTQTQNVAAIQTANRALGILNQGIISGTGADQRVWLDNLAASMGLKSADDLSNTQAFRSAVSNLARLSAKGLTSRITQWELKWLNEMQGGNISSALPVLQKILQAVKAGHEDAINLINRRAGQIRSSVPAAAGLFPDIAIPSDDSAAGAPASAGSAPAPPPAAQFKDSAKEAKYQAWKKANGF